MSFNELLGHRLKEIRKRKELTQETVAELAGITAQHISNIENGKTKVSMDTFIKILKVLNVSADVILSDCISVDHTVYQAEVMDILKDCNQNELKILVQFLESTKVILRNNRWL